MMPFPFDQFVIEGQLSTDAGIIAVEVADVFGVFTIFWGVGAPSGTGELASLIVEGDPLKAGSG